MSHPEGHHEEEHHHQHEEVSSSTEPGTAGEHVPEPDAPVLASAPTADENNGFNGWENLVPPTASALPPSVDNAIDAVLDTVADLGDSVTAKSDEISKAMSDLGTSTEAALSQAAQTIVAEADSTTKPAVAVEPPKKPATAGPTPAVVKKDKDDSNCSLCPYYLLGCDYLKNVNIPPKVKDLLLWKDLKVTGAVFGTAFTLLLSFAMFSLLTVVGSLSLLVLSVVGAYRFYLAVVFRIKGTYDDTFDKLSSYDMTLPKEKWQELTRLVENDASRVLNQFKSILLWDNVTKSTIAFVAFYFIYCIGSWFNTLTILIILLVDLFTLPKVYEVYKKQIDECIEKMTTCAHGLVKQVMVKLPFLNKKKTQ